MTETQPANRASAEPAATASGWLSRWLFPILRIAFLVFAAWLIWYTAGHWDRWTGAARFETTDDAFVSGDVTPLSARVSGYITEMPVNDFQTVRKGDLIAVIDPSDYQAQLDLAQANLAAAQAMLANLANQRIVQHRLLHGHRGGERAGGQKPGVPLILSGLRHVSLQWGWLDYGRAPYYKSNR